ncbi:MAG: hypothetical protein M1814_000564 [Vezdaea aestivalis]|nr:MAG: hypothetical protein M1814_000564 [Vezdaea aestivalis]
MGPKRKTKSAAAKETTTKATPKSAPTAGQDTVSPGYTDFDPAAFDDEADSESGEPPVKKLRTLGEATKKKNAPKPDEDSEGSQRIKGVDFRAAPLDNLHDIFTEMASRAVAGGFKGVVDRLNGRKLTVATMCSGTESPLLAMGIIGEALKKVHSMEFAVDHLFSVEIVPFKQAYIERNFAPPIIFRDVTEVAPTIWDKNRDNDEESDKAKRGMATDAYGAVHEIPDGPVDLLVAGPSCIDYSKLNLKAINTMQEKTGESARTAHSVLQYVKDYRPRMIILENVFGAPWGEIVKACRAIGFAATFLKCDSKDYYLPQTRQRGYLFAIDSLAFPTEERESLAKSITDKWASSMNHHFKRPTSASIESFLLPESDPRALRGREEFCREGLGEDYLGKESDWTACQGRYLDYRSEQKLGPRRPMTKWEIGGYFKGPDYMWHAWLRRQVDRIKDTLDISYLRAAIRGYDGLYKTRIWDLSQNVDRFTDNSPFGIAGCITPSGQFFITPRGGPLLGIEALALQGIPIDELNLTKETNTELQDLAGNAMTSTVVGSAILAALLASWKHLEPGSGKQVTSEEKTGLAIVQTNHLIDNVPVWEWEQKLTNEQFQVIAQTGARLCLCEGQSIVAKSQVYKCELCSHTCCHDCKGNPTHQYVLGERVQRASPGNAASQIKRAIPMTLKFLTSEGLFRIPKGSRLPPALRQAEAAAVVKLANEAIGSQVYFKSVKRGQAWTATYESDAAILTLTIQPDSIQWNLFAKVPKSLPRNSGIRRQLTNPIARMQARSGLLRGTWEICLPAKDEFEVQIQNGPETMPCWEYRIGITAPAFSDRRIPTTMSLNLPQDSKVAKLIAGKYEYLPDCGTASSSLYRNTEAKPSPVYLFLDPSRVGEAADDQFVFAASRHRLNFQEYRQFIARVSTAAWSPSDKSAPKSIKCTTGGLWIDCPKLELKAPRQNGAMQKARTISGVFDEELTKTNDQCDTRTAYTALLEILLADESSQEGVDNTWSSMRPVDSSTVLEKYSWLTEKLRNLPQLEPWKIIGTVSSEKRLSCCVPPVPQLNWATNAKGDFVALELPKAAGNYEQQVKARPEPFLIEYKGTRMDAASIRLSVLPQGLAHRATASFPESTNSSCNFQLSWRMLSNFVDPLRFQRRRYLLASNAGGSTANEPKEFGLPLRQDQKRSLKWMLERESGKGMFTEEEIEEAILPQMGWRLEARASRQVSVRGGVLADHVGYGKTVIILALIASNPSKDLKPATSLNIQDGKLKLKATLVLVPSHLTTQWNKEAKKFMPKSTKIIVIRTGGDFKKWTIKQFQEADIIIFSLSLFTSVTHYDRTAQYGRMWRTATNGPIRRWAYWLDMCMTHMRDLVNQSQEQEWPDLLKYMQSKHRELRGRKEYMTFDPSKRNKKKAEVDQSESQEKPIAEKDAEPTQGPEPDLPKPDLPNSKVAKDEAKEGRAGDIFDEDPCGMSGHKGRFEDLRGPPLHLFQFHRVVVDEFSLTESFTKLQISKLNTPMKWILSGTPPLGDFADIKGIAELLGVHLGRDEISSASMRKKNIKELQNKLTAVEAFNSFRTIKSNTWHTHRTGQAQLFLDHFVRQNTTAVESIVLVSHYIGVELNFAERALYMELQQHLLGSRMEIKIGKKTKSDRETRLNKNLAESTTAMEALIKGGSFLDCVWNEKQTPLDTMIEARQIERVEVLIDIRRLLYEAFAQHAKHFDRFGWVQEHFLAWMDHLEENEFGDLPSELAVKKEIALAFGGRSQWRAVFPRDRTDRPRFSEHKTPMADAKLLRATVVQLRALTSELVSRTRATRFLSSIRDSQAANLKSPSAYWSICRGCRRFDATTAQSWVMGRCGHVICEDCVKANKFQDICPTAGCSSEMRPIYSYKASAFGTLEPPLQKSGQYGAKFERLVSLVKHEIPKDEQIILFVQFPSVIQSVANALEAMKVKFLIMQQEQGQASILEKFKEDKKQRILLLNVDDATATGSNLVNANHVIFYSTLVKSNRADYNAVMMQAIGRARRYGQKRDVNVYHLLSLETADVDVFEERNRITLAKESGKFVARKRQLGVKGQFRSNLDDMLRLADLDPKAGRADESDDEDEAEMVGEDEAEDVEMTNAGEGADFGDEQPTGSALQDDDDEDMYD